MRIFNSAGGKCVVDSDFSLKKYPFLIKSSQVNRILLPTMSILQEGKTEQGSNCYAAICWMGNAGHSVVVSSSQGSLHIRRTRRAKNHLKDDDSTVQCACQVGWHQPNQKHVLASIERDCKCDVFGISIHWKRKWWHPPSSYKLFVCLIFYSPRSYTY